MAMVVREVRDPEYVPNGNEIAVIKTARGTVRVKLYGLECPLTVPRTASTTIWLFMRGKKIPSCWEGAL